MYDDLIKHLDKKGIKIKVENNVTTKEKITKEYDTKEKTKALTQAERLDRIEKLLGI